MFRYGLWGMLLKQDLAVTYVVWPYFYKGAHFHWPNCFDLACEEMHFMQALCWSKLTVVVGHSYLFAWSSKSFLTFMKWDIHQDWFLSLGQVYAVRVESVFIFFLALSICHVCLWCHNTFMGVFSYVAFYSFWVLWCLFNWQRVCFTSWKSVLVQGTFTRVTLFWTLSFCSSFSRSYVLG